MMFGIKVTNLAGQRIGFGRAVARYFASWLSALILLLGYLMAAVTSRKQALHDLLVGTLVVNRDAAPDAVPRAGATMPLTLGVVAMDLLAVVTPLGVAAVGIPAYRDFTARARVSEAIALGSELKTEIAEARQANQPHKLGRIENSRTRNVRDAAVSAGGVITIRMPRDVANGGAIIFTPIMDSGGQIASWNCRAEDVPEKYLPGMCRH